MPTVDLDAIRSRQAGAVAHLYSDRRPLANPGKAAGCAHDLVERDVPALLAEVDRLTHLLKQEDAAHGETIRDRDRAQSLADQLAAAIERITGVEIGEHSNANDPWENALQAATEYADDIAPDEPDEDDDKPWTHGTRLGREHRSVREHLVEDHGVPQAQVDAWSDGAVHGHHDGVHRKICAYAENLPHPAPGELGKCQCSTFPMAGGAADCPNHVPGATPVS